MAQYFAHETIETHIHTSGNEASSAIYIGVIALVVIAIIFVVAMSIVTKKPTQKSDKSAEDK